MKVRLIQAYARAFSAFASFQFHEGSINTNRRYTNAKMLFDYFNSMKVRLILNGNNGYGGPGVFQFHEGSINTRYYYTRYCL